MTTTAPVEDSTVSVLIIEDDLDTADSLARFLRLGCGYTVATAPDGLKGIQMAVADRPDVVVCDIGLPKKNGLLVAEELAMSLPRRPLLIAVTGYGEQVSKDLAEAVGFDHYMLKPADPFRIAGLIEAHLCTPAGVCRTIRDRACSVQELVRADELALVSHAESLQLPSSRRLSP